MPTSAYDSSSPARTGAILGARIGGVAGLAWIAWGTGVLPPAVGVPVLVLSVLTLVIALRHLKTPPGVGGRVEPAPGYGKVVAGEVLAIVAGLVVLDGVLDAPQANAAWISFVVGVHFFALDRVFPGGRLNPLGAAVTTCGVAGLVAAAADATTAAVTAVAALPTGAVLLGSAVLVARRT